MNLSVNLIDETLNSFETVNVIANKMIDYSSIGIEVAAKELMSGFAWGAYNNLNDLREEITYMSENVSEYCFNVQVTPNDVIEAGELVIHVITNVTNGDIRKAAYCG